MVSKEIKITMPKGLHLRPAGELAEKSLKYPCRVMLQCGDKEVSAKSLLGVLSLCIRENTILSLTCEGPDEEVAAEEISEFLKNLQAHAY